MKLRSALMFGLIVLLIGVFIEVIGEYTNWKMIGFLFYLDFIGLTICGFRFCQDFGGIIHVFTFPISFSIIFFVITLLYSKIIKRISEKPRVDESKEISWKSFTLIIIYLILGIVFFDYFGLEILFMIVYIFFFFTTRFKWIKIVFGTLLILINIWFMGNDPNYKEILFRILIILVSIYGIYLGIKAKRINLY